MVSIIVPIFNREKYLKRCIESIIYQTYTDIEIILINDGSTDRSSQICDEYAATDSRVKVSHQQNVGLAISRIRGIAMAHGDYIMFVDSDDWIEPNMVECLLGKAISESVDIVWCDFVSHLPEPIIFMTPFENRPSAMLNAIYSENKLPAFLWNKLYRAQVLENLEVSDTDFKEDMFYSTQILSRNPSMSYVPRPLYHYDRTTADALSKSKDFELKCFLIYEQCYKFLESQNLLKIYESSLSKRILNYKFRLLKQGLIKEAQSVLPFANYNIHYYPISFPVSIIYWIGFNGSKFGSLFLSLYIKLWINRRKLHKS